ncbi:neuroglian isoform X3 [Aplysia californica]|uniref:Neuroglian isoform X3 n=1 Tax=Aplysia californica TaxID=6500 RepID=A0ABM1A935_APLCA|nr:neuroglian isoform X3 [Aplysia californica]
MLKTRMLRSVFSVSVLVVTALAVSRPPAIFLQPTKNIYYKAYETVQMPCKATGEPKPGYFWKRNEIDFNPSGNDVRIVQLPGAGTLVINRPEDKDEGIYQCFARNDFGISVSVTVNLRQARLGKFDYAKPRNHYPRLGQPYMLNCVPPESVPPPAVFWVTKLKIGGMEVLNYDARVSMDREYRLRFAHVEPGDDKDGQPYACVASNSIMRDNSPGPLHYMIPQGRMEYRTVEYLWADQNDRFGLAGDTFNVKCIFGGNPTPDVHWERTDNKTMSDRAKLKSFAQELEITNLQPEDAGKYECWATNSMSQERKIRTFSIRVQSRPVFLKEPQDVEIGVGGNVEFECVAEANPEPSIVWFVDGTPFDKLEDPRFKGRLKKPVETKLFIENVVQTDHMVIQCNASNTHGYVFADVYLNVLSEAPTIVEPPRAMQLSAEGQPVNLTCQVTGKPDPIITWFKNSEQITGGRYEILPNGHLQIRSVVLADAGHYRCQAQNRFNSTSAEGSLVVRRKTQIEQRPGDLEVNAGKDGKFTCSGTTDPEEVNNLRIVWYKDGKPITANDQRMTTNNQDNSLTISGTIVRDSGTYTCVATNGLDQSSASAVLTVKDRPDAPSKVYHEYCNKNATLHWMPGSYNNAPVQYYVLQYNTSFNPDQWNFGLKVNATLNKVNMTLSPFVDYTFRVIAYNKIGPSEPSFPSKVVCTTKPDRPSFHPRNLRTLGHQPGKLYIEWTPIPPLQQNGLGFYYSLQILREGDSEELGLQTFKINDWETSFKEISTGRVYEPYRITMKAGNNLGEAKENAPTITGYSYESYPVISPTNIQVIEIGDTYAVFTWDFLKSEIGKRNTKIRGQFMGFKIQFWEENYKIFTIREEDIGPDSATNTTGNTFRARVENMLPNTRMEAHIAVMNNFYIGTPTDSVRFRTLRGFPGPVQYFRPINIGDTHVNLEWGAPEENRGDLEGYDISYRLVNGLDLGEMQEREPQINDPFATNSYLSGLSPRSKYRIYIYARTVKGRGESYFIEVITGKAGTPRMPSFSIVSVGSHNINITWWINAFADSGTVVFVEYRKLDGAEWLRTTDEVVHTWKNIENLEAGTKYEIRLKTTNGVTSVASGIDEVTTDGTAEAYALVGNPLWFAMMLLSIVLIIALLVLFFICYRQGFRFNDRANTPYSYNAPYSDTVGVAQGSEHFGPEPQGYNNDYYDRRDYPAYEDDQGGFDEKRPPSYSSDKPPPHGDYEPYDDRYDSQYYNGQGAPQGGGNYDYEDYGQDDRNYGGQRRDDYYGQDPYYGDRHRDDYYDERDRGGYNDGRHNYDYDDRDPPTASAPPSEASAGKASSTFV